jgi:hypothetical protein
MGRPRKLNGRITRAVVLDAETELEAQTLANFSVWVRAQLRARLNGEAPVIITEVPTRRLAAVLMNRIQRMVREAGDDTESMPVDGLLAIEEAISAWFTNGS